MKLTSISYIGIVLSAVFCSASVPAADFLRLTDDLDGDGKAEVISISVTGTGDFQKYSVRIGKAYYADEFFAVDGDLPQLSLVRMNASRKEKQILVTTIGPVDCRYELLSFHEGKLIHLLSHRSRDCDKPQFDGSGAVETLSPEGFWKRRDRYVLVEGNTQIKRDGRTIYPVETSNITRGVAGIATKLLSLKPAECKSATIPPGGQVMVTDYDMSKKQYLLRGSGETCGWLAESELPSSVDQLPWAG